MTNEMVLERTSNLAMPSNYVELDSEEMSYVEGGGKISTFWWGTRIHLSRDEADALGYGLSTAYGVLGLIASFIPEPTVSKVLAVACFANATAIATALIICNSDKGINIDFSWLHYAAFLSGGAGTAGLLVATAIRKA